MTNTISVSPDHTAAVTTTRELLRQSGTWWDAEQIAAIANRAEARSRQRAEPPWMHAVPDAAGVLPAAALDVIDRVAGDPGSVDAAWAAEQIAALGDAPYVELVGTTAVAVALRIHADAVGSKSAAIEPAPEPGSPTRERPDGVGDIGAHVPMLEPFPFANVARALSLVPSANATFYALTRPMYSAAGFDRLVWDTPLSRPQVELVASRVAAMNECFY